MLPADVYSRFLRATDRNVLFICATDEHGTPAELAAADSKQNVSEYCEQKHELQADIYKRFPLSFDHFGRSSSLENRETTQHFAQRLQANGFWRSGRSVSITRRMTVDFCRIGMSSVLVLSVAILVPEERNRAVAFVG